MEDIILETVEFGKVDANVYNDWKNRLSRIIREKRKFRSGRFDRFGIRTTNVIKFLKKRQFDLEKRINQYSFYFGDKSVYEMYCKSHNNENYMM